MTEIKLPAMSPTMEEGTLAKWLVKEGDTVKPGDVLAEIETDKATMELEADEGGVVEKLHVPDGSDGVKVGTLIATIRGEDEAATTEAPVAAGAPSDAPASAEPAPASAPSASPPSAPPSSSGEGDHRFSAMVEGASGGKPQPVNSPSTTPEAARSPSPGSGGGLSAPAGAMTDAKPNAVTDAEPNEGKAESAASPDAKETPGNADAVPAAAGQPAVKPKDGEAPASLQVKPEIPGPTHRQTVREALRDAMAEEMRADPLVFIMGEEVAEYQGAYKVTQGLLEEFGPARVVDTPITEYGFAGLGTGAAMGGLKPIVEFMTFNFAMQAIDHIVNSAAKTNYMSGGQMRCPMVFRGPNGSASRVAAQHSQNYGPWYASVPGLIVIAPYSAADAKGLLKSAIRSPDPVVFLENELLYGHSFDVPDGDVALPIGKANIVRAGKDVTIVSYSIGVGIALDAATKLAEEGIDAEVVDLRTLRPLDRATVLASLKKTNRMVVVEEGWPTCSISSEIIAIAMEEGFDDLDAPVLRVTNEDVPLPYAANLEKLAIVKVDDVVGAVKKVCYRGS